MKKFYTKSLLYRHFSHIRTIFSSIPKQYVLLNIYETKTYDGFPILIYYILSTGLQQKK